MDCRLTRGQETALPAILNNPCSNFPASKSPKGMIARVSVQGNVVAATRKKQRRSGKKHKTARPEQDQDTTAPPPAPEIKSQNPYQSNTVSLPFLHLGVPACWCRTTSSMWTSPDPSNVSLAADCLIAESATDSNVFDVETTSR
uniref:Uncharacterized protein n=1 Tax=Hemiselmis andersenii TaxID=464988 RepID=A0A6U4N9U9_HEMAN|mmetsp:Transcript_26234/g.60776  ORF Transcript_26234/g.60776 Transcript_26234/m.60776 type:complete len:144 (+) Transcript_26234:116-547(+)